MLTNIMYSRYSCSTGMIGIPSYGTGTAMNSTVIPLEYSNTITLDQGSVDSAPLCTVVTVHSASTIALFIDLVVQL